MVHYYRTTKDGRIAFGQGGHRHAFGGRVTDDFFAYSEAAERRLRTDLVRLVPYAEGVNVTHGWGGPIDRTVDGAPSSDGSRAAFPWSMRSAIPGTVSRPA